MKAVILAAGLGTRLLPATKGTPKEMLPIFALGEGGKIYLKPVLQVIFEQLYNVGFRELCLVISKEKRVIKDFFNPDIEFAKYLKEKGKEDIAKEMEAFYRKVKETKIVFINQPRMKGTGDAVLRAKAFTGNDPFLLHMGDDIILSKGNNHLRRLVQVFEELNADAAFFALRVKNPKIYGVIDGVKVAENLYEVKNIVYQPKVPPSNLSDVCAYILRSNIYPEIEKVKPDERTGEISLIPAIQSLIDKGGKVYALELSEGVRLDIGNTELYWEALNLARQYVLTQKNRFLEE